MVRTPILLLVVVALAAQPLIADDIYRVAPPSVGAMSVISFPSPAVAFGDSGGLAIWRTPDNAIWAIPFDSLGKPTTVARRIPVEDMDYAQAPGLVFINGSYVMWWKTTFPITMRYTRLNPDLSIRSTGTTRFVTSPPLAWNDQLIVTNAGLTLEFLDHDFEPVRSFVLPDALYIKGARAVVLDDGSFAVMTWGTRGVLLHWFSPAGEVRGPAVTIEPARAAADRQPYGGSIGTDGTSVLVTWTSGGYPHAPELRTALVTPGSAPGPFATIGRHQWASLWNVVDVLWRGDRYFVFFSASGSLHRFEIDRSGAVARGGPVLDSRSETRLIATGAAGTDFVVVFSQGPWSQSELRSVRLPAALLPGSAPDEALISLAAANQFAPAAAAAADSWFTVWKEQTGTSTEIRGALLHRNGRPASAPLVLGNVRHFDRDPLRVVFNGIDFVVAWVDPDFKLVAKRVTTSGVVIDAEPIVIARTVDYSMATNGGATLIVWSHSSTIYGALLHPNGIVSDQHLLGPVPTPFVPHQTHVSHTAPRVAADGEGFLLAWVTSETSPCSMPPCSQTSTTFARWVDSSGTLTTAPIRLANGRFLSVAATRSAGLVLFRGLNLVAAIIDRTTATVSAPIRIGSSSDGVVFTDGDGFEVVYPSDGRYERLRLSADGTKHEIDTFTTIALPAARNTSGALLALATLRIQEPPYYGAIGLVDEVTNILEPGRVRRRSAGR